MRPCEKLIGIGLKDPIYLEPNDHLYKQFLLHTKAQSSTIFYMSQFSTSFLAQLAIANMTKTRKSTCAFRICFGYFCDHRTGILEYLLVFVNFLFRSWMIMRGYFRTRAVSSRMSSSRRWLYHQSSRCK